MPAQALGAVTLGRSGDLPALHTPPRRTFAQEPSYLRAYYQLITKGVVETARENLVIGPL